MTMKVDAVFSMVRLAVRVVRFALPLPVGAQRALLARRLGLLEGRAVETGLRDGVGVPSCGVSAQEWDPRSIPLART